MLGSEDDKVRRSVLSAELDLHDNIVETLKDNKTRNAEARALKEQRIAQLEKLIDIMLVGQSGTPEVTNAQIRNVHLKLKLSPKTIEDTYVKKGFVVQKREKVVNLNEVFLTTVQETLAAKSNNSEQCLFQNIRGHLKSLIFLIWLAISVEAQKQKLPVSEEREQQNCIASWKPAQHSWPAT